MKMALVSRILFETCPTGNVMLTDSSLSLFEMLFDTVSHQVDGGDVQHSLSSLRIAFIMNIQSA